ncbi:MAG: cob(I)yrinic acid a,c-diamide adenosyltransferase [Candidatus Kapabacteria bacterium]|nr:cob(I)yrinic acid a,c-diamide adenosyltransferase [Ignavibacteriota bacterium]MCW5884399.1 cob(I)yrinic acid a,c-diamide adenosyltransferase [Candidatus Kapabacteria bacterium]
MKIYTKTGDDGTTGLFNGVRVSKYDIRVESYGTVDELNSIIGLARTFTAHIEISDALKIISNTLFTLGSDLATPLNPPPKFEVTRLSPESIAYLENLIDEYTDKLPPLKSFILPGGSQSASFLHQARTVCRRAERLIVRLSELENIGPFVIIFINRLSDYLFTAARYENHLSGISDNVWEK